MSPTFPNHPLDKTDLRLLLAQGVQPEAGTMTLSSSALRTAKQWAIAANLLNEQGLTDEGRVVVMRDPYLEATVTDWLIHFHLSLAERSLWKYVVDEFLPAHPSFTQDELLNACAEVFTTESSDKLRKSVRLLLKTYTNSQAIAKSQFLIQEKKRYSTGNSDSSNPYTIGYLFAKLWERKFKTQSAVLVNQILDAEMGLAHVLGITQERLRQQLDILEKHEIIEQRSAKPHLTGTQTRRKQDTEASYQIIRCWDDSLKLLEQAYENDSATPNQPLVRSLESILNDDNDTPDFSKFLEWVVHLPPRQAYLLLNFGAIAV